MASTYTELIERLRDSAKIEQASCESEGIYDSGHAKMLRAAADAIETLSNGINAYYEEAFKRSHELSCARERIDELEDEKTVIENRLLRLLRSETIREYDKVNPRHGGFVLDIEGLDRRMQELIETEERCAAADAPVYVATRSDILQRAARRECADDCFEALADMWSAYSRKHFSAQDVAMMLALLHIVRIGRGYASEESFADLAGYAACGGEYWAKLHAAAQMACCASAADELAAD